MTRKDYEKIADVFREYEFTDPQDKVNFAYRMAQMLRDDNARFDRERFLHACGVGL